MKRKTNYNDDVDLILSADWHMREDQPVSRTDDFPSAQWSKIAQIALLQNKYDCPVVIAGDLFHHWKPSPELLSKCIQNLPKLFYTVFGQHDLPQHNLQLQSKSGIWTLWWAGILDLIDHGSWGQSIGEFTTIDENRRVGVWHKFVWDGKNLPWPGCEGMTAKQVLKKYPEFDLIVTGDHHKPFTYEYKGRLLVNPGCLTRQASDYVNHKPRVYLWNAETNKVRIHYLEIEKDVISREHIEKKEETDKRLESFISRLSEDWEVAVSFEENLKRFLQNNKIKRSVIDLVYKAIDV